MSEGSKCGHFFLFYSSLVKVNLRFKANNFIKIVFFKRIRFIFKAVIEKLLWRRRKEEMEEA